MDTPNEWKGSPPSGQPPINATNNATLDSSIKPYVVEHTWLTANNNNTVKNDYTFKAHATVMSSTEFRKYADKFYVAAKMMLRNGRKDNSNAFQYYNYETKYFNAMGPTARTYYVFPIFYLTEDFFKNVKLDLSKTGADVRALILEHNNSDEAALRAIGYDTADLVELGVIVGAEFASLTNASGSDVVAGSVTGTTSLTATYTLTNNAAAAKDVSLIIAVYDGDEMAHVGYNKVTATVGESTPSVEVTGLDTTKTYKVKIMVWNDMDSITNLCDAVEF